MMNQYDTPKISIIVPVYKVEDYITECIDSILAQSFKDFELILVDDGSPDGSGKICDRYAERDTRVRVLHQKNAGQAYARNAGIDASKGDILAFVDSDDKLAMGGLKILYNEIQSSNADIVLGKVSRFTSGQGERPYTRLEERKEMKGEEALSLILQGSKLNISVCGGIYKRKIFDNLRMPTGYICEDWYITPSIYLKSKKVIFNPALYYLYRDNPQSTMATLSKHCNPQVIEVAQHVIGIIHEHDKDLYLTTLWSNLKRIWKYVGIIYIRKRWKEECNFLEKVRKLMLFYQKDLIKSNCIGDVEKIGILSFCHCEPLCKLLYYFKSISSK